MAEPVRQALAILELAAGESAGFDPATSQRTFHLHMSDIGEVRFLPELMIALREQAPGVRVETLPLPRAEITAALDSGRIAFRGRARQPVGCGSSSWPCRTVEKPPQSKVGCRDHDPPEPLTGETK